MADYGNDTIRKITPAGVVSTLATLAGTEAPAPWPAVETEIPAASPEGIATDSAGNVYVTDTLNNTILKITSAGVVSTLAGTAGISGSADGTGAAARFDGPAGLATDSAGNVYVADNGNNAIRKITPAGEVSTIVGTPGQMDFEQGALPGLLGQPVGVAISGTSLYITLYNGVAVAQGLP